MCVPVKEFMFVHERNNDIKKKKKKKIYSLVGHYLLVLHEACEAEVSPVFSVGHFL